mmetsp:Transcript_7610/g.11524  ORF Transcript_7610/g.11524 Transcript_7610/m.11524 type:complete len:376 (-) Transcript_7610:123-1250(-)
MASLSLLLALPLASAVSVTPITSVPQLNEKIRSDGGAVGFLSQANYESVQSVLPKEPMLTVSIFTHAEDVEASVRNGSLLAGLFSSCPTNDDGAFNLFGAGLVTPRASFFKPSTNASDPMDSMDLRIAWDAAIVQAISEGDYEALESKYWASNKFDSVGAFTCSISTTNFAFPSAANATGLLKKVLETKTLTVAALGPSNWGYQGNYQVANPTGLWPEYMMNIFDKFNAAYGGDINLVRKFESSSASVMNLIANDEADLTEPYWTVSAFHEGVARTQTFDYSCTVLGTESCFFTSSLADGGVSDDNEDESFPRWAIALIVVLSLLAIGGIIFTCVLISSEKAGKPLFYSTLNSSDKGVGKHDSVASIDMKAGVNA